MYVLEITKTGLFTDLMFVLYNDGNIFSEKVHVRMSEDDESIIFQSELEKLSQHCGPIPRPAYRQ